MHTALGSPPLCSLVPSKRSGSWQTACASLRAALLEADLPSIRCPGTLWSLLHDCPLPRGARWRDLCGHFVLDDLRRALAAARSSLLPSFLVWNVGYLRSTLAHKNQAKLATITKASAHGRIALLQETHWSDHDVGVWTTMFPARRVVATPGFIGPGGGWSGGVAIVLSHDYELVETCVLA